MKKRIRSAMAPLVCVGLFLVLSPNVFKECGIPWFNWDSVTGPRNFYFTKRQWLADARTIAAAIRFLYESNIGSQANPMEVVDLPHPPPLRIITTNFSGMSVPAAS
jgi:hypothetical protein